MRKLILFTDGSVNTKSKTGYGAYLAVSDLSLSIDQLKSAVKLKRFINTSSTKLELQTLIWALSEVKMSHTNIIIYTDSQNIIGLPARRAQLKKNNYCSIKGKRLNNHEQYQAFFTMIAGVDYELIKVRGHIPAKQKDDMDRLFTLVDRAARVALRQQEL